MYSLKCNAHAACIMWNWEEVKCTLILDFGVGLSNIVNRPLVTHLLSS